MLCSRRHDDAGQGVTAFALIVAIGLGFLVLHVLLPLGGASAQRGKAQTAADAAALAGAKELRTQVLARWGRPLPNRLAVDGWVRCGVGGPQAQHYAGLNDARVSQYCYLPGPDRVEVTVSGATPVDGRVATASATAEIGIRWGSCRWTPDPLAPLVRQHFTCGAFDVTFLEDPDTGIVTLETPLPVIEKALEPRLVA